MSFDYLTYTYKYIYLYLYVRWIYNYIDSNLKMMYKYSVTLYNVTTMPKIPKYLHQW